MVMITAVFFMFLNAFLPLDFLLEATEYPFKLKINLEKTMFRLGEPVNVTWILTNIGNEKVTLYNSRDDTPDFLIRDANFNYVFQYGSYFGILTVIYPIGTIASGDSMTTTGMWEQIHDGSHKVDSELSFKQVPPGTYYVAGIFDSATYDVVIETPVIRITILGV